MEQQQRSLGIYGTGGVHSLQQHVRFFIPTYGIVTNTEYCTAVPAWVGKL